MPWLFICIFLWYYSCILLFCLSYHLINLYFLSFISARKHVRTKHVVMSCYYCFFVLCLIRNLKYNSIIELTRNMWYLSLPCKCNSILLTLSLMHVLHFFSFCYLMLDPSNARCFVFRKLEEEDHEVLVLSIN
jgi:hypothetical protein